MNILKFGLRPLIIIFIVFVITAAAVGKWQFEKQISSELEKLKEITSKSSNEEIIKNKDLQQLPFPVKKWLASIGIIGNRKIRAVKLKQKGLMKLKPKQEKYFKPKAEQYISVTGELKEYKTVNGISIPSKIDVSWYLDSGKFSWYKIEVDEISFKY